MNKNCKQCKKEFEAKEELDMYSVAKTVRKKL